MQKNNISIYGAMLISYSLMSSLCVAEHEANGTSHADALTDVRDSNQAVQVSENDIQNVMDFWNGLKLIHAKFIQINQNGDKLKGTLWLKKASGSKARMRLDYEAAAKQQILLKESELLIFDLADASVSAYPLSMTPLDLIVNPKLVLGKDVILVKAVRKNDTIQMVMKPSSDTPGTLTLYVNMRSGIQFVGWKILDSQGIETRVVFDPETIRLNDKKIVSESVFNIK